MKQFIATAVMGIVLAFAAAITPSTSVGAVDLLGGCSKPGAPADCKVVQQNTLKTDSSNQVWNILTLVLQILGGVAVVMIVIGGIRYATSNGDASKVKAAKDTIMYAVIGLVVAILAGAIVMLVSDYFAK